MSMERLLPVLSLLVALAALGIALTSRRSSGSSRRRSSSEPGPGGGAGSSMWHPPGASQQVVDGTMVTWDAHDRLVKEVQALREQVVSIADRLTDQEKLIFELRQRSGSPSTPSGSSGSSGWGGGAPPRGGGRDELGFYTGGEVSLEPASARGLAELVPTPANGRPVELRDGAVVLSRSLASVAVLVEEGAGQGSLYVNDQVEIDHMALERWSTFFDFGAGKPYQRYRTERPATVAWDPVAGRGDLREPGRARSLSS